MGLHERPDQGLVAVGLRRCRPGPGRPDTGAWVFTGDHRDEMALANRLDLVVLELLRKEADRLRKQREIDRRRRRIETISRRYGRRLPTRPAAPEAIVGHGEDGLPT